MNNISPECPQRLQEGERCQVFLPLLGWGAVGSHHFPMKLLLLIMPSSSPVKTALFTSSNILVQGRDPGDTSSFYMLEFQVSTLSSRCSQDAVKGQRINDLITNREEKIHLEFSEDCLYLNIYTPAYVTKSSRLPVSTGTALVACATASRSSVGLERD